jgi:large subunit ribosomal protein L29
MSEEEMKEKLRELRAELAKALATVRAGGTLENPMKIRQIKRDIARILTVARERRTGGG